MRKMGEPIDAAFARGEDEAEDRGKERKEELLEGPKWAIF